MALFFTPIVRILLSFTVLLGSVPLLAQQATDQDIRGLRRNINTVQSGVNNNTREIGNVRDRANENYRVIQDVRSNLLDQEDSLRKQLTYTDSIKQLVYSTQDSLIKTQEAIETIQDRTGLNSNHLDRFWILICAILVFFMQAGFKALEVGMVRKTHRSGVGMKNLVDWLVVCAIFYLLGFGFMFGDSQFGIIGWGLFLPDAEQMAILNHDFKLEFFLFQLAFAGTAATIVSGAMSERSALTSYMLTALLIGGFVYPLFGHWAWGGMFIAENEPWLASLGFHDFAGSTVVHSIGAWVALAGIYIIGPRRGRFDPTQKERFKPSDLGYSVLGVFILWFGWWGFNGGSTLAYTDEVSYVILNTNLAAAFAGIAAFLHAYFLDRENTYVKFIGGVLGGLVAITACCNVVTPSSAILIGLLAGIIHNVTLDLLLKWRLDDPVGAIPVHGFCGVWGTLAVGLFGIEEKLPTGSRIQQIMIQLLGIVVAFVFAAGTAIIMFRTINHFVGLRVSAEKEDNGFTVAADKKRINAEV